MHLVALSGYGRTEDKMESYRVGFEGHLLKPVDEVTLKTVVERYFRKIEREITINEGTRLEAGGST
jgi:YesN/AraC family two-component response regulator